MNTLRSIGAFCFLSALALGGCARDGGWAGTAQRGGGSPANTPTGRVDGGADRREVAGQYRYTLAYPTGERETSMLLLEANGPEEVRVGQPYNYTVRVTNLTDTPLHAVRVNDVSGIETAGRNSTAAGALPGAATAPTTRATAAGRRSINGEASGWDVGTLGPKQTQTREFSATTDALGTLRTCLSVEYNPSLCIAVEVTQPELEVVKAGPEAVLLCQEISYTYTVRNAGTGVAENVVLEESLPEGLQTAEGGRTVSLPVGDLRQGESKKVTARLRATRIGEFASRATAKTPDLQAQSRVVTTTVREPVLAVEVEGPEATYVGQAFNYRVTVRNTGDAPAEKTVLRLTSVGGTERIANRDLGTLPPGESRTVNVSTRAARDVSAASLTAAAEAVCATAVTAATKVEIRTIPALQLEVVDGEDPVQIGANTTYTVTVRNEGSGADTNVRLKGTLPEEMQFIRGDGASAVTAEGRDLTFGPIARLAPGAVATWSIQVKALRAADGRFGLELNSASLGRPAVETEPTRIFDPKNIDAVNDSPADGQSRPAPLTPQQLDREPTPDVPADPATPVAPDLNK